MSTQSRRPSFSSSTASPMGPPSLGKKRAPLGDITNHKNVPQKAVCSSKIAKVKKGAPAWISRTGFSGENLPASLNVKPSTIGPCKVTSVLSCDENGPIIAAVPASCDLDVSPSKSNGISVSLGETMSTCESFKSPEVEYIDNTDDVPGIDSINKKTVSKLYIPDHAEPAAENVCSWGIPVDMETDYKIINIDNNYQAPQLCATIACDIYKHLRASELKKRPSTDFMERVQKGINASMRAILIDWLVEVAEEYRLVPDTLYLTVNYIDRYLSGNEMSRQKLQLLGVACVMIAAKYEEVGVPRVEEFCDITDNTYFRDEVLEMESAILNYLKFEMTAPTAICFLRRFVRAAHGINEFPSMQLECLANYITELSLLEYRMLCYAPSLIAASAVFLAKYILVPSKRPWNSTLQHYTLYQPSDLSGCVGELHRLCCGSYNSTLPAIREKYSQHKYKFVSKKYCPPSIPQEYFNNQNAKQQDSSSNSLLDKLPVNLSFFQWPSLWSSRLSVKSNLVTKINFE